MSVLARLISGGRQDFVLIFCLFGENLQNCSLNRLWSPMVGLNEGKSNMMVPLLQSAPSDVL